jgi:hypothetical protein
MDTFTSSSNSSTSWFPTIVTSPYIHPGNWAITSGTYTTSNAINYEIDIKRCRVCNHAHLEEKSGCIEYVGSTIYFISWCCCMEYVPTDNLEYLEWCYERRSKRGSNETIKEDF